jgi:hypothetical protein
MEWEEVALISRRKMAMTGSEAIALSKGESEGQGMFLAASGHYY